MLTTALSGGELQDAEWYERHGITLILGEKGVVSELDCQERLVSTEDGPVYRYGKHLFIATGLRPLKPVDLQIPGHDSNNIFVIRQVEQAGALVNRLLSAECQPPSEHHVVIAGGGTLGVELAAACSGWGLQVSMCFPEQHLLPALFTDELSEVLENKLRTHGVQILASHFVTGFQQDPADETGSVTVSLQGPGGVDDKVELPSSAVIVCVGSRANTEILTGWCEFFRSGAKVDQDLRLEAYPEVFILGDICAYPHPHQRGKYLRVEHYENAKASAVHAARSAFSPPNSMPPYELLPWFNSNIFEYSESPLCWEFYGDEHAPDIAHFEYGGAGLGGFWIANGHVAGGCLIRSPPPPAEDLAKMRSIVLMKPRVTDQEKVSELGLQAFDDYVAPPEK
jgi:monodehydroascorbate reductase (NADH)